MNTNNQQDSTKTPLTTAEIAVGVIALAVITAIQTVVIIGLMTPVASH